MFRQERHERHDRRDRADRPDRQGQDRHDQRRPFGKKPAKFHLPKGTKIDYKDINLLQKYITDRGKMLSRRYTGVSAKDQRELSRAIKQARFLGK